MRRRKLRRALATTAVFAVGFLVYAWFASPDWSATAWIGQGKTRLEVEFLMGCPPGDYGTHEPEPEDSSNSCLWSDKTVLQVENDDWSVTALRWTDDEHALVVTFDDKSGRSIFVGEPKVCRRKAGPLDAFRWRLSRIWHSCFP